MKLLFLGFLLLSGFSRSSDLAAIRDLYRKAPENEAACRDLLRMTSPFNEKNDVVMAGYKAAATMMMAKFLGNPFRKLSWFYRGKDLLEKAISTDHECVELRYIRYCVQMGCPRMLGYHGDIRADQGYLQRFVLQDGDGQLKAMIRDVLKLPIQK